MPIRVRPLAALLLCLAAPAGAQSGGREIPPDPDFPDLPPPGQGSTEEQFRRAQQGMRKHIGEAQERQQQEFLRLSERMEEQYQGLMERMAAQRGRFRKRMAQQWADVQESTSRVWVDYADKGDARSKVDFERGEVEVEVLVPIEEVAPGKRGADKLDPAQEKKLRALAEEKLLQQTQRMLAQPAPQPEARPAPEKAPPPPPPPPEKKGPAAQAAPEKKAPPPPAAPERKEPPAQAAPEKKAPPAPAAPEKKEAPKQAAPVLKDQIKGPDGKALTAKDADDYVKKQLAPKMEVDPKPVTGEDGKQRLKVKVKIPMVPDHIKIRADRYAPEVKEQAQKAGLDPALVYAVIHTESSFNPMARSNAGAFGLMQLIPSQGAHEAWRYLHKKEKVVTADDLYDPAVNIRLGATYLKLLQTQALSKLKNEENRMLLSVASYNCGPTKVKRSVIGSRDVDAMSADEVVELVADRAPGETKDYVVRVRERMQLYKGL